ncbi:hypothetical protein EVAR_55843_1 [Eumeta japonica]|uniref:Uncharacterized protein n=1 Tax=Eumeta variegata TaxID=151549 RepID=A0A4C1ZCJ9_EUMVA|nr:hypothetical protein EVAR_55843_1 [Eumeta japonica]
MNKPCSLFNTCRDSAVGCKAASLGGRYVIVRSHRHGEGAAIKYPFDKLSYITSYPSSFRARLSSAIYSGPIHHSLRMIRVGASTMRIGNVLRCRRTWASRHLSKLTRCGSEAGNDHRAVTTSENYGLTCSLKQEQSSI